MLEKFKSVPLNVKIACCILITMYLLLLAIATPIALLLGVLGLSMWSVITIVNHFTR